MTFANPLLERWGSGRTVLVTWLMIPHPLVAEALASCGCDAVVVDQQHGAAGVGDLPALFAAISGQGAVPITRVPANDAAAIGRSLDLGALGVIVPMVDTPEEAARAVAACRYAPGGIRSYGPLRASSTVGSQDPGVLERTALILQIETASGLEHVDEIAATAGVDALLVGPMDLALGLGLSPHAALRTPAEAERHATAVETIRQACERAGIAAGIYCEDGASARRYVEQGFRLVSVVTDRALLSSDATHELELARGT